MRMKVNERKPEGREEKGRTRRRRKRRWWW